MIKINIKIELEGKKTITIKKKLSALHIQL